MEKILTAVPYPMTAGWIWGTVCTEHPTWLNDNVPTDRNRESAEAYAETHVCTHPAHFGVDTVHVVSATAVVVDGTNHQLGMCGVDMGPYLDIPKCHPVGNYLWSGSPLWETVNCAGCLARCGRQKEEQA